MTIKLINIELKPEVQFPMLQSKGKALKNKKNKKTECVRTCNWNWKVLDHYDRVKERESWIAEHGRRKVHCSIARGGKMAWRDQENQRRQISSQVRHDSALYERQRQLLFPSKLIRSMKTSSWSAQLSFLAPTIPLHITHRPWSFAQLSLPFLECLADSLALSNNVSFLSSIWNLINSRHSTLADLCWPVPWTVSNDQSSASDQCFMLAG